MDKQPPHLRVIPGGNEPPEPPDSSPSKNSDDSTGFRVSGNFGCLLAVLFLTPPGWVVLYYLVQGLLFVIGAPNALEGS